MNNDLIKRSELKKALDAIKQTGYDTENEPLFDYVELPDLIKAIDNAPTVTSFTLEDIEGIRAETIKMMKNRYERPQGEWILNKDENPECPFCHHSFTYWGNFCGNCGAKMQKGDAE